MLDFITSFYNDLMALTKSAPVFGGALMLWLIGIISYICRSIPNRIWTFARAQFTTRLDLTNVGSWVNEVNYDLFLTWFFKQRHASHTRSFSLNSTWGFEGYTTAITAGLGLQFFVYKGRLFWFSRAREMNSVSDKFKENLVLTGLTRNKQLIYDIVDEFKQNRKGKGNTVYRWANKEWDQGRPLHKRTLESVAIKQSIKDQILKEIKTFKDNESWYAIRGIPYKLVFLIYGPSGTGKTSLIRAIASEIANDIYELPSSQMTDTTLNDALGKLSTNSILLVEDFEGHGALKQRTNAIRAPSTVRDIKHETPAIESIANALPTPKPAGETLRESLALLEPLTLSGFLNSLDGIAPLHNTIVFLTSNDVADLDDAVLRAGRIDSKHYIGLSDDDTIKTYINVVKGDYHVNLDDLEFKPILGCDLIDIYRKVGFNIPEFISAIPVLSGTADVISNIDHRLQQAKHTCDFTDETRHSPSHCRICNIRAQGSCQ